MSELNLDEFERMQREPIRLPYTTVGIKILLYPDGAMSFEGPTIDPDYCIEIMEEAIHMMRRQKRMDKKPKSMIITPSEDVSVKPLRFESWRD